MKRKKKKKKKRRKKKKRKKKTMMMVMMMVVMVMMIMVMVMVMMMMMIFIKKSSGLGQHMAKGIVTARLNKPTELVSVNKTVCNDKVEWHYNHTGETSKLCLTYGPNTNKSIGYCQGRGQFHCQNNSLVFYSVTLNDAGVYMERIISADTGYITTINITLKVIAPPQITSLSINSTQSALIITCEVGGENVSSMWLKDGQALQQNDQQVLQNMNKTLMVHEPTGRDCGNYTCLASGDGGTAEAHLNINGKTQNSLDLANCPI
ncbi:hypothetical protein ACEWY4_009551 [Coilia grayii]|uniref:Ig-like domain-containing protein n=1 Tax=Coilia grayii TaxID=363190 RepID=A0ABD1K6S6_9TELE